MKNTQNARREKTPEVNAGSMADIAFLLLIFFLVTTEIVEDRGLLVKLPPWEENPPTITLDEDNVLTVLVNGKDELLVDGTRMQIDHLAATTEDFVLNPLGKMNRPKSPRMAIVSIKSDRSTSYAAYLAVYNEVQTAYNKMWDDYAVKHFMQPYDNDLPSKLKSEVKLNIPMLVSEAEPTDYFAAVGME